MFTRKSLGLMAATVLILVVASMLTLGMATRADAKRVSHSNPSWCPDRYTIMECTLICVQKGATKKAKKWKCDLRRFGTKAA